MSAREVKIGILSSYGIFIADILAALIFTPFLINSLGQSEYGVYALIGSVVGSLMVLDFGFGSAIIRYVAQYRAENRKDKEQNLIATCLLLYGIIALIALGIGLVLLFFIDDIFGSKLSDSELSIAHSMFIISVFSVSISFLLGVFNAYIQGYEKFIVINSITLIRLIVRISVLTILLSLGFKSIMVVIVDALLNLATGILYILFTRVRLGLRVKLSKFDIRLLKEISNYSFFIFISSITDILFWRSGSFVLGATVGAKAVAVYTVGITLVSYFQYISGVINEKLFPAITRMVVRGSDGNHLTSFCAKIGRIQFILLSGILLGFQLFGDDFVYLWIGSNYLLSWWIGLILMTVMIVQAIQYPCVMILRAKKKDGLRTVLQLIIIAVGVFLGNILIKWYSVIGMTLGLGIAVALLNLILISMHYRKMFDFKPLTFLKQIVKLLPSIGVAYIFGRLLEFIPVGDSWGIFILKCAIFTGFYAISVWYLGANEFEKSLVTSIFNRLTKLTVKTN
ncbi:lipopolysaccharide biosynthesis protein [Geobacillus sp. Manikaran-105]|uniref:lipopolysaccharide biosynthesis protein n=1 Tax=Geobacillus sp. Manikaran-105 TaxID=2055940 RepID=UPI0012FD5C13|nr:oligosaccharide flippase family protein [Geobacillus sp. Manikaran-105]